MKTRKRSWSRRTKPCAVRRLMDKRALIGMLTGRRPRFAWKICRASSPMSNSPGLPLFQISRKYRAISKISANSSVPLRSTGRQGPDHLRLRAPRDPFEQRTGNFTRLDIANALGSPIKATADGVVLVASWQGGYGRM